MLCKVTHCAGYISANTRPHQLHWGDWETATSCAQGQYNSVSYKRRFVLIIINLENISCLDVMHMWIPSSTLYTSYAVCRSTLRHATCMCVYIIYYTACRSDQSADLCLHSERDNGYGRNSVGMEIEPQLKFIQRT